MKQNTLSLYTRLCGEGDVSSLRCPQVVIADPTNVRVLHSFSDKLKIEFSVHPLNNAEKGKGKKVVPVTFTLPAVLQWRSAGYVPTGEDVRMVERD